MKTSIKFLIPVLILCAVISYSYYLKKDLNVDLETSTNSVLKTLPSFVLPDLNGNLIDSKSFNKNGKPFYMHLWATWCGPCEAEFGEMLKYANSKKDKNVLFYFIKIKWGYG